MVSALQQPFSPRVLNERQIYVPVRLGIGARGESTVVDNGGDTIAVCPNEVVARGIADAINRDAGFQPPVNVVRSEFSG